MTTLLVWGGIAAIGAVIGLFLRPRTIGIISAVAFGAAVLGIVVGYGVGNETLGFMSGVAAMAIPFIGGLLALGAAALRALLGRG